MQSIWWNYDRFLKFLRVKVKNDYLIVKQKNLFLKNSHENFLGKRHER